MGRAFHGIIFNHKFMSNINEQGWNDTKLGYEAAKLTCLLIFIIFKVHNSKSTTWVEVIAYVIFSHSCHCNHNMHKHKNF
jgi:hypothetical protein